MEEGAQNEIARDVLVRVLRTTGKGLSWLLLYDPGWRMYALNLVVVKGGVLVA